MKYELDLAEETVSLDLSFVNLILLACLLGWMYETVTEDKCAIVRECQAARASKCK